MTRQILRPLVLGFALFSMFMALLLPAQTSKTPETYSVIYVAGFDDPAHPDTIKVYRDGAKEFIELTSPASPADPKGARQSFLFDFQAHKTYTRDLVHNTCSAEKYSPANAPDMDIFGAARQHAEGATIPVLEKQGYKVVGTETVNGMPTKVLEVSMGQMGSSKAWVSEQNNIMVKMAVFPPTGPPITMVELKQLSFATPAASLFVVPSGCTESQAEWTQPGGGAQGAASGASGAAATGPLVIHWGSEEFTDSNQLSPSSDSCTVLFRPLYYGTMAPLPGGYKVKLRLGQGNTQDVTNQLQNGVLRINNAPENFTLDLEWPDHSASANVFRQCFHPETVLLFIQRDKLGQQWIGCDWCWVKSGKYATIPRGSGGAALGTQETQESKNIAASQATAAASSPANLVTNGDFESGKTGFTSGYTYGDVSGPGAYWIGANASKAPGAYGDWYNGGDHTTGTGNMFVVDGANSATTPVWEEVVPVTPNTTYTFSYCGAEVDHDSNSLPRLQVNINGGAVGTSVFPENSPDNGGKWENFTFTWNSGSSTRADLVLIDLNTDTPWNDFALDDISFGAQ